MESFRGFHHVGFFFGFILDELIERHPARFDPISLNPVWKEQIMKRIPKLSMATITLATWLLVGQAGMAQTIPAESATNNGEPQQRTIDDAIELAGTHRTGLKQVKDYTAVFTKTELVGNKVIKQSMDIKCRHEPFSVYLHNRFGKEGSREVLYVTGANDGDLLVHERGFLASLVGTQKLKLDDTLVMAENRYPITDFGVARIVDKSLDTWQAEKKSDLQNIEVRIYSQAKIGATPCEMIEVTRKHKKADFHCSLTRVYFVSESKLPIRAEQFGWPEKTGDKPPLIEVYDYADIKVNVGLTDTDFDPQNPKYGFGGSKRR